MAIQETTPGSPELSVVSADGQAPLLPPQLAPALFLEIRRGRTVFPKRPVNSRNFLIGSGPASDLRLGGEDIPASHSLLVVTDGDARVQWLAEFPPLYVNGEPTHQSALGDGDQISIGKFEFIVHRSPAQGAAQESPPKHQVSLPADSPMETAALLNLVSQARELEEREDLAELSASELLELLETDQHAVETFEEAIRRGEAALLHAATQRAADLRDDSSAELDQEPIVEAEPIDGDILVELEMVIKQLSGFSAELDQRATRLANQESTQAEAAELLLDAQKELASQLERFHKQVTETHQSPEPKLRKAA
jgi:hypothetical protein